MIDAAIIRNEPDRVRRVTADKRGDPSLVDKFLVLDETWRKLTGEVQELRGKQKTLSGPEEREAAKQNKVELKKLEGELREAEEQRDTVWSAIPNLTLKEVPVGEDESGNEVIRSWGTPPSFNFKVRDHIELGAMLDIIDMEKAATISGSRFYYLKGAAVLIEFALVQLVMKTLTSTETMAEIAGKVGADARPFVPVIPPVMIKPEPYRRMGRLTKEDEDEKFYIPKDDLYLIGSAEHTLGPLHMDETLTPEQLPIRYVGFSTAFRREAGSYGKDTRGILRVHQFDKIELESFVQGSDGEREQDMMVAIQEYLMQQLELPYQVVNVCTGDMGGPDARQIDIETWMPSQGKYRETHSADYMTDYQSRRLHTKVKRDGENELVHMNDATAIAVSRTLIAILENNQQEDGSVVVPAVLRDYVGLEVIRQNN